MKINEEEVVKQVLVAADDLIEMIDYCCKHRLSPSSLLDKADEYIKLRKMIDTGENK